MGRSKYEIGANKQNDIFYAIRNDLITKVFINKNKCLKYIKERNSKIDIESKKK
jgi:hypothetical protein